MVFNLTVAEQPSNVDSLKVKGRAASLLRGMQSRSVALLLAGSYAWFSTVALPAHTASRALGPRIAAAVAFAALLLGAVPASKAQRWRVQVGSYGFVSASLLCWLLLGDRLATARLDLGQTVLGALSWALFALGVRPESDFSGANPRLVGSRLTGQAHTPKVVDWVFLTMAGVGLVPAFLAWKVGRELHAGFAHVVACAAGLGAFFIAAEIATSWGKWRADGTPMARLGRTGGSLAVLLVLLALGLLAKVL